HSRWSAFLACNRVAGDIVPCSPPECNPVPGFSSRALGSSLALVLIEPSAHVRRGCTPFKSRPGPLAAGRAHLAVRPRPLGLHPGQVAPWAARWRSCSSRGQRTSAPGDVFLRTRRGRAANETLPSKKELESCPPPYLTSEGQIKEKARKYAASAYLPPGSSKRRKEPHTSAYSTLGANKRTPA